MNKNVQGESGRKKYYKPEDSFIITDSIIAFIGIGLIIMASFSSFKDVLKEFVFGATLAGF